MPDQGQAAEQEGWNAHDDGAPISSNPYTDLSLVLCQRWRKGWQGAEAYLDAYNEQVQFREPR